MIAAALNKAAAEREVTITEETQVSVSFRQEDCVETFDMAASNADVNSSNCDAVAIHNFYSESCFSVKLPA